MIGISCGLFSQHENEAVEKITLDNDTLEESEAILRKICVGFGLKSTAVNQSQPEPLVSYLGKDLELMLSGKSFTLLNSNPEMHEILNLVLSNAAAVILFRSSPKEKADIVKFIKRFHPNKVALSIGDGANDVNMIQTAHIGVGIYGKEGNQAAAFADYAICEFRHLRRLVFWHGRHFGCRVSDY